LKKNVVKNYRKYPLAGIKKLKKFIICRNEKAIAIKEKIFLVLLFIL
jgi:hypothetical protein